MFIKMSFVSAFIKVVLEICEYVNVVKWICSCSFLPFLHKKYTSFVHRSYCMQQFYIYVCVCVCIYTHTHTHTHARTHTQRVSREECARLRENVPEVKVHRSNQKHLYPKLNGYGDNGERKVQSSCGSTYCTWFAWRIARTLRTSVVQSKASSSAFKVWLHM